MDKELTKRFALLFRGLEAAYGTFDLTGKEANGKRKGKASVVRAKRTLATFEKHLNGEQGVGIVPINEKNASFFGAIDIDQYPLDHAAIVKTVHRQKLPLVVCRSKSGGGHVYLFLKEPVPAETLQNKLKELASEIGCAAGTEIFPKQIQLVLERGDTGNFLNLPYFDHENGLRYAFKEDGSAATLEEFVEMAEATAITPQELEALLEKEIVEVDERIKSGPPCL